MALFWKIAVRLQKYHIPGLVCFKSTQTRQSVSPVLLQAGETRCISLYNCYTRNRIIDAKCFGLCCALAGPSLLCLMVLNIFENSSHTGIHVLYMALSQG